MSKVFYTINFFLLGFALTAQTFELEQIQQLFRPRLKMDARYIFNSEIKDTSGMFNHGETSLAFTFPIRTKLGAEVKLDVQSLKLKDILKNSVKLQASQTLGIMRFGGRQTTIGFDSLPVKNTMNASMGMLGVRLTKKYRVRFWSAVANISEQDKTLPNVVPRATAMIGQLHLRGIKKSFFYGIAAVYSDGLLLPAPFFGGSQPIGKKFIFNYTLPVQINLQYKDDRKTLITAGISADGFRTGILYHQNRVNLNYTSVYSFLNLRYKFSNTFSARAEGGYVLYQNLRYSGDDSYKRVYYPGTGPYVQAGFSVLFGKTVWEKIMDGLTFNK